MSLLRNDYCCDRPLSENVQGYDNPFEHKDYYHPKHLLTQSAPVDLPFKHLSDCSAHYEDDIDRDLNPHDNPHDNPYDNSNLWRTILENKVSYFEKMAGIPLSSSPTIISSLSKKESLNWELMVTNPRFITFSPQSLGQGLPKLKESLRLYKSDIKNHELAVTFNCEDLVRDATYYVLHPTNKAELESNVYREHFLTGGQAISAPPIEGRTLHRFIQPELKYSNKLALPHSYSREISNRRKSALARIDAVWDIPRHSLLKEKERKDTRFYPDHVYACQASEKDRNMRAFQLEIPQLPAFRVVADFPCDNLLPPHVLNENKAKKDDYIQALNYMLLVSAIVLHERLLLSSLTEDTLKDQQFQLRDSHRVFFITCCGHITTVHEMRLRNIWTLPGQLEKAGEPVAYDASELARLDMRIKGDCEQLKQWVNAIHEWGITIHYDSVMKDGNAAADRQAKIPIALQDLRQRAFSYGKEPNTIKYHLWRDQAAVDTDRSTGERGEEGQEGQEGEEIWGRRGLLSTLKLVHDEKSTTSR